MKPGTRFVSAVGGPRHADEKQMEEHQTIGKLRHHQKPDVSEFKETSGHSLFQDHKWNLIKQRETSKAQRQCFWVLHTEKLHSSLSEK